MLLLQASIYSKNQRQGFFLMKISYNWLNNYLPTATGSEETDPETLSTILTAIGLEVESLEKYQQIAGGLEGLVLGKVLEVSPHPNADRLKITRVDVGREAPLQIVCGAPNVAVNQQVVVAPVGTTIYPVHGEPLKMKKAKIRGQESFGMICAADEIGLGEDHEGILTLDGDARPGMQAKEYFKPVEDWIYEIGLTPNRMDAMSHIGVARDVCARLGHDAGRKMLPDLAPVTNFKVTGKTPPIKISIEDEKACPRYSGLSLSHITVGPSPQWLQQRLLAIGVRPINNVVDITNFVLHECGQPLHAFDLKAIKGNQIKVKTLPEGTSFVTLDKETRKLNAKDLMICNAEEGMCIAGVFGGLHSGVTDQTTEIFLESACFNPVSIRRTSFRHGLRTDAATHFEKGVDISGTLYALKRAALLMVELCGAQIASEITDCYPHPKQKTRIVLKKEYLARLSGKDFTIDQAASILDNLNFEIIEQQEDRLTAAAPFSKPDMMIAADLVEEIMRIDGYDHIDIPTHIRIAPSLNPDNDIEKLKERMSAYLVNNGFNEILTNSITNSKYYPKDASLIRLMNSLSSELDVLRPTLLETGLEAVAYNLNRRQENILFFETGKTYLRQNEKEENRLALFASGNKLPENWLHSTRPIDPYFLKGHVQNLLTSSGIALHRLTLRPAKNEDLQQALALQIDGENVGSLGLVSPSKRHTFDLKQEVWYAVLNLEKLKRYLPKKELTFEEIPKHPFVRRDLALILDKNIPYASVENTITEIKAGILDQVRLFDVFESDKLGVGKKSFGVSFIFRHPAKTLTDKEIDKVMKRIIQTFEKRLGAEIRS